MATIRMSGALTHVMPALLWVLMLFLLMTPIAAHAATPGATVPPGVGGAGEVAPGQETGQTGPEPSMTQPTMIVGLGPAGTPPGGLSISMGDELLVRLNGTAPLNAADWSLFLDGHEIPGLSTSTAFDDASHGLVFKLRRTDKSKESWNAILGSPTMTRELTVAVAKTSDKDKSRLRTAAGAPPATFQLDIISGWWFLAALVFGVLVILGTYWAATGTAILRDAFLIQIPPRERSFSLGRCQMAFWFVLVIGSFLFLWLLLWDSNTLNAQALALMGISAATGLGAVVANTSRSETVEAVDAALKDKKLSTWEDVLKLRADLAKSIQNSDRTNQMILEEKIDAYNALVKDYISATCIPGSERINYRKIMVDLINDDGGPTLHRLQLVAWTVVLGVIFVVGIYRDLTMPEFSTTLLALMAFTGTAYIGFKIPEKIPDKPS